MFGFMYLYMYVCKEKEKERERGRGIHTERQDLRLSCAVDSEMKDIQDDVPNVLGCTNGHDIYVYTEYVCIHKFKYIYIYM